MQPAGGANRARQDPEGSLLRSRSEHLHSYFVDDEFSFEATAGALIERDFHGVLDVAHFVAPHLILDVQAHHWKKLKMYKTKKERTLRWINNVLKWRKLRFRWQKINILSLKVKG